MKTNDQTRSGGCLCGQVRYTAPAKPISVAACHCRDCQKQAGSAVSVLAIFPSSAVSMEGSLGVYQGRGSSGGEVLRYFCPQCGSPIHSEVPGLAERGIMAIKAGTLDDVSDLQPAIHYWTQSRQPWMILPDGVPCLERE